MANRVILLTVLTAACGAAPSLPAPPAAATAAAAAASAPAEEILAPPFTAADLRAGLPAGTEIRLQMEKAGEAPVVEHWVFTQADERGCRIHSRTLALDGTLIKDEGEGPATWDELVTHAHFPAARTTRTDSSVEVPAGRFDTWLFEVRPGAPGEPVKRMHFARTLPGPPVWMEVAQGEQIVLRMTLLSRKSP